MPSRMVKYHEMDGGTCCARGMGAPWCGGTKAQAVTGQSADLPKAATGSRNGSRYHADLSLVITPYWPTGGIETSDGSLSSMWWLRVSEPK